MSFEQKYAEGTRDITHAELLARADQFVRQEYDPERPTIVLLPGGMGSELMVIPNALTEADLPIDGGHPPPGATLWLSAGALQRFMLGDYMLLKLTERDVEEQRRICFAHGALQGRGFSPYTGLRKELRTWANYVEFGYDWRRPPSVAADHLKSFLRYLDDAARNHGKPSPRRNLTLLAHSQGGLVGKIFVSNLENDPDQDPTEWYRYLISVATPFYGTLDHVNRYYVGGTGTTELAVLIAVLLGEKMRVRVNLADAWSIAVRKFRGLVATFPGLYILCPAPTSALDETACAALGLPRYPVSDPQGNAIDFLNSSDKHPGWVRTHYGPSTRYRILSDYARITSPLTGYSAERAFYVRGVRGSDPEGPPAMMTWDPDIDTDVSVEPSRACDELERFAALTTTPDGTHDGTVPLWSAALASTRPEHTKTITGRVNHRMLIAAKPVGAAIADLVRSDSWDPRSVASTGSDDEQTTKREICREVAGRDGNEDSLGILTERLFD